MSPTGIRGRENIGRHIARMAVYMIKPAFIVYRKIARIGQSLSPLGNTNVQSSAEFYLNINNRRLVQVLQRFHEEFVWWIN